ncbi:hypothetical protein J437_LFUL000956 [Ladona fulva]|uniref:chitinase n=1 Tax=Ladona fulva TaxID=123851 RepID=A0A8K0K6Q8_LADFU|nr:hypothetical protein J437_LFUL000956 [Ladona fulva]
MTACMAGRFMASSQTALLLLGLFGLAASASLAENDRKVVVCYYGSWAVYRPGAGKFDVEDIDPFICTHIIYGFAGLSSYKGVMTSLDPWNDLYDNYGKVSMIYYRLYEDGWDFDWEYPALRGGGANDKNFSMHYWIEKGAPAEKLVMGMPLYGRAFTLDHDDEDGLYAPATQPGIAGPYTRERGFIGYNEICDQMKANPSAWKTTRDPYYMAPYTVNERQWIGYDDMESIKVKAQYVAKMGLKGAMVWSIETDDFHGGCHGQKFPLMHAIWDGLNGGDVPTPPDTPPTDATPDSNSTYPTKPTTTKRPTTAHPTPPPNDICKKEGLNPDPKDCGYFYLCTPDKFAAVAMVNTEEMVVSCYYASWAVYRPGAGKFDVEDIDPFICTHIIYAFAGLSDSKGVMVSLDPWNDLYDNYGKGAYMRFTKLKKKNPALKTLLSIGGWNEGSAKYSQMVATYTGRNLFLKNAVKFLKKYGFDGLDFDWEFPGLRGGNTEDKENFAQFLEEMRLLFDQYGLMMTAAVSAGKLTIDISYDVPALGKYLDLINVMCYDYHGSFEPYTGHNDPLFRGPDDKGDNAYLNTNFSIHYWIEKGAPREKLVMGIPLYGRTFTLDHEDQAGLYAPAHQPGEPGPFTRAPGLLGYNEICYQMKTSPSAWETTRDPFCQAPYAVNGRQWVGYDDVESVKTKAAFAANLRLKGVMVWSIETDDFHGVCHSRKFPLMTAIWNGLKVQSFSKVEEPSYQTKSSQAKPQRGVFKEGTFGFCGSHPRFMSLNISFLVGRVMASSQIALLLLALVGLGAAASVATKEQKVVVCYYGSWAVYRPGAGKFNVEDIDPFICTHIIYGFAGLSSYKGVMTSLDPWNDLYDNYGKGAFERFTKLKAKNPSLKALLAIGGWNEGSAKYSQMVASQEGRNTFLINAVEFLKKYGFDGLDFDWEYPGLRGGGPNDKNAKTGYLDHIHVMCYDYHGAWDPFTGQNAPLYWGPGDKGDYAYFNTNFSMHYWMEQGAPKEKLVMGIPLYGRSFTLSHEDQDGLYATATQPGIAGPYTREAGFIGFNEVTN